METTDFQPPTKLQRAAGAIHSLVTHNRYTTFTVKYLSEYTHIGYSSVLAICKRMVKDGMAERHDQIWPIHNGKRMSLWRLIGIRYSDPWKTSNRKWEHND